MVLFSCRASIALHLLILLQSAESFNAFTVPSTRSTTINSGSSLIQLQAKQGGGASSKTRERFKNYNLSPEENDSAEISKLKSQLHYIKGQVTEANLRAAAAGKRVAKLSRESEKKKQKEASKWKNESEQVDWKQQEQNFRKREQQFKQREQELQSKLDKVKEESSKTSGTTTAVLSKEEFKQKMIEFQKREEEYKKRERELKNELKEARARKKDEISWLVDAGKKEQEEKEQQSSETQATALEKLAAAKKAVKEKAAIEKAAAEKAASIKAAAEKAAAEAAEAAKIAERAATAKKAAADKLEAGKSQQQQQQQKNASPTQPSGSINGSPVFPSGFANTIPNKPSSPTSPAGTVNGSPVFPSVPANTIPNKPASPFPPTYGANTIPDKPAPGTTNGSPVFPSGTTTAPNQPASTTSTPENVNGPRNTVSDEAESAFRQVASWAFKSKTESSIDTTTSGRPALPETDPDSEFRQMASWVFRPGSEQAVSRTDNGGFENPALRPPPPGDDDVGNPEIDPELAFRRGASWASSPRMAIETDDPELAFRRGASWASSPRIAIEPENPENAFRKGAEWVSTPKPVQELEKPVSASDITNGSNSTVLKGLNKTLATGSKKTVLAAPLSNTADILEESSSPFAEGTVNGWNMAAEGRAIGILNETLSTMKKHNMFDKSASLPANVTSVKIDGGCLKTCSFTKAVDRVEVSLKSIGRPLNSNIELWQGPNNTPQKMRVYSENGEERPFRAVIETPYSTNSVAIRNTAPLELPFTAVVDHTLKNVPGGPSVSPAKRLYDSVTPTKIQGLATHTTPCDPSVKSVQVMLKTDGCPLTARIELLQGPNNNKQVLEVYTEDGSNFPFYAIIDTPGEGNVVRVINQGQVEFPMSVLVQPYEEELRDNSSRMKEQGGGIRWS